MLQEDIEMKELYSLRKNYCICYIIKNKAYVLKEFKNGKEVIPANKKI